MQKSRKNSKAPRRAGSAQPGRPGAVWRARRLPNVPPPAPLLKVLLRTTARPAIQEASFSRRSGQHHGSRRGGAGPAGVEQGLRSIPGAPVQVSTLGAIAVGAPLHPAVALREAHRHPSPGCSPPCVSWRSHLCSGGSEAGWRGKSAPGHQVETLSGRAPAWSLETWRR